MYRKSVLFVLFQIILVTTAFGGDSLEEAFKEGKPYLDVRYRFEYVDQDGFEDEAKASTLRTRLGYKTGEFYDTLAVIEFENITHIGDDDYNDTLNGRTNFPVVADVENTEVNQAFLQYSGIPDSMLKVGRQVITLDGHRFIGHVGWRQNNQTFDAVTFQNKSIEDTVIKAGFINGVNRIFGDDSPMGDWDSQSSYYNISNSSTPLGTITTYGYFLDFEDEAPAVSSQTFGVSVTGKKAVSEDVSVKYHAEYANQSDYGDNMTDYNTDHFHIAPGIIVKGVSVVVGYEVLGSDDGMAGFSTPLATLHKWNGWADKFLGTPATGLEDFYVEIAYKVKNLEGNLECLNGLLTKFQYHDFSADEGGADYGKEWGVFMKKPINKNVYVEAKFANYDADTISTDTKKFTFGLGFKY